MLTNTLELIDSLDKLGRHIESRPDSLVLAIQSAYNHNRWFTESNIEYALESITTNFLQKDKLIAWASHYDIKEHKPIQIGIIMAGNIPLVSFHDLLCVLVSGNKALVKLSSKDNILLPYLLDELYTINPALKDKVEITERLNHADAIIATGSNNTSRYFEYYFARFPKIIRHNRGSVAVLTGEETSSDFVNLGVDIFRYFGLGCRNISKLYVPGAYTFDKFFEGIAGFSDIQYHSKYKNNYDYNRTLLLMNKTHHLANDFLIVKQDVDISSPVAELHFEHYTTREDLRAKLEQHASEIQCVVGKGFIPFGETQSPTLGDYADDVDTMRFLIGLNS